MSQLGTLIPAFDRLTIAVEALDRRLATSPLPAPALAPAPARAVPPRSQRRRPSGPVQVFAAEISSALGPTRGLGAAMSRLTVAHQQAVPAINAATAAWRQMVAMVAVASPQAAATYRGSWDLLMARIGTVFVPAVEQASRSLQEMAGWVKTITGGPGGRAQQAVGAVSGSPLPGILGAVITGPISMALAPFNLIADKLSRWITGMSLKEGFRELFGGPDMKRSLAGLPPAQISTTEEYYDRLQMAALNNDDIQTEILKEQLENLKVIGGLLEKIGNNTDGLDNIQPAFR